LISPLKLFKDYNYCLFRSKTESNYFKSSLFHKIWFRDKVLKSSPLNAGLPWMTFNAIFFLNNILKGNEIVFETGCGGSTIFYLERVRSLLSIEHESSWSDKLKRDKRISKYSKKWECAHRDLHLDKSNNEDDSPYLQRLRELPDNSFHLGSIDGRLRSQSLIISTKKIMSGGHLLLDNSDRVEYYEGINYIEKLGWKKKDFSGLVYDYDWESSTTVWQKL
jgi:hypothetical protein